MISLFPKIFYMADIGKSRDQLSKSVFVEKLGARGYEVLLFGEPLDEVLVQNLRKWKWVRHSSFLWFWPVSRTLSFQDVAKAGLKFGDEGTVSTLYSLVPNSENK